ncbi:MAG: glycine cleavage system protein H [Candidatus Bathyarchaeota archaeon]|jgi:glycine cleavage system H protein|nr:MAG: glycine cleavage system protein H [Candidatus Bathyarchaeota archaeon]
MKVGKYAVPEDYHYIKEHEWAKKENGDNWKIGITDYAQKALREITYFYPGKRGSEVKRMETICKIESQKCVSEILSPLSGMVLRFNNGLFDTPEIINSDPYGKGWIVIIRPSNLEKEQKGLLTPELYAKHISKLAKTDETLLIHRWRKGTEKEATE